MISLKAICKCDVNYSISHLFTFCRSIGTNSHKMIDLSLGYPSDDCSFDKKKMPSDKPIILWELLTSKNSIISLEINKNLKI